MIYTILYLEISHTPYHLYLDKTGNLYTVTLYDKDTKKSIDRDFQSIDEAYTVYGKISEWYAKGLYRQEEKESYLLTGVIPA